MAVFTNSEITLIKLKAEEIWANGQYKDQYEVKAEAARAVLTEQSAVIRPIEGNPDKDNQVEVTWINACDIADEACPADWCDVTAPELTTKKKTYNLNLCRAAGFSLDENDIAKSIYSRQEVVAIGALQAKAKLDEYLSAQTLISLNANAGVNQYPEQYTYVTADKTTNIPTADYNRKIVPYFEKTAIMHNIVRPYYIDNGGLWIDWRNAELDRNNLNGQGDNARTEAIRLYFDMKGFVKAAVAPDDTFMVGKHAVALGNRYYNPDRPEKMEMRNGVQTRWNEASANLPGIRYDVIYQMTCLGKRFVHTWKYFVTAGVFVNPEGCPPAVGQPGATGILSFSRL